MTLFHKATKTQKRLRLSLYGVSGSGKTYSALALAKGLGGKVAMIDTERGSASAYANLFAFDTLEMVPPFSPAAYVAAIKAAEAEGYDILIIDSLTHAWSGAGGALEMVDNAAKRSQSQNSYTAWRDVTPEHNRLIDAIIGSKCHIIATMRSKAEYVLEEDSRGKKVPKKKGMAPIQRDGMEYEFDVVAEMTSDNEMVIQKTRCPELSGQIIAKPNGATSATLRAWLSDGAPMPAPEPAPAGAISTPGGIVSAPITNGHKPDTWAAKVAALDASDTHLEALKTTYGDLFAIVTAASEGIAPYAAPPANRGEALARCRDMAVIADKAQQEAAQ
jgi:hypothetical protein